MGYLRRVYVVETKDGNGWNVATIKISQTDARAYIRREIQMGENPQWYRIISFTRDTIEGGDEQVS